ncbi:gamma-glutamyl hydrolase 2-like isoform X1 [Salvia splendens]|uniref:gamma-glutamyl hydrolase 2-like isoform X1 n=1 Tax=Salvia splendens TaxID=180675 RepID=UPI0011022270|nr:gamma-glutamyl hydrolase 2-like isoform X1 [Salvia splendens]
MLYVTWISLLLLLSNVLTASVNAHSTHALLLLPTHSHAAVSGQRCPAPDPNLNFRPVIGIVSHPGDGCSGRLSNATNASYIAASYVKFVESAGARVVPLIYNEPPEVLYKKLSLVNGVIFTGGSSKTGLYFEVVTSIFKDVLRKNDAGDRFPLLAICLGFELLTMIVSKDNNILERFSASDQASTLQFVENIDISGTVFQRFPPVLLNKLSTECIVMQNHKFGISPEKLQKTESLSSFFEILTTTADSDDKVYVSTAQAHRYPVTALQWHPERVRHKIFDLKCKCFIFNIPMQKNAFEWASSSIPHSEDAIQVTQNVANFFIREARLSTHRPPSQEVLDNLIYNYSPTYCGKAGKGFDEVYIFS